MECKYPSKLRNVTQQASGFWLGAYMTYLWFSLWAFGLAAQYRGLNMITNAILVPPCYIYTTVDEIYLALP